MFSLSLTSNFSIFAWFSCVSFSSEIVSRCWCPILPPPVFHHFYDRNLFNTKPVTFHELIEQVPNQFGQLSFLERSSSALIFSQFIITFTQRLSVGTTSRFYASSPPSRFTEFYQVSRDWCHSLSISFFRVLMARTGYLYANIAWMCFRYHIPGIHPNRICCRRN